MQIIDYINSNSFAFSLSDFHPNENAVIVIRTNTDNINVADAHTIHNIVSDAFPNNKVITIPAYASIEEETRRGIIQRLSYGIGSVHERWEAEYVINPGAARRITEFMDRHHCGLSECAAILNAFDSNGGEAP